MRQLGIPPRSLIPRSIFFPPWHQVSSPHLFLTEYSLCSRHCYVRNCRHPHLPLMSFGSPMKMKESVAVSAQVPTHIAQNDCRSFTVIVVITHWLEKDISRRYSRLARKAQTLTHPERDLSTTGSDCYSGL